MNGHETEAKFHVQNLKKIEMRLQALKAHLIQARVLEKNLRFDRPDGSLTAEGRVLRLRQDDQARLTYKDAGAIESGLISRREIEFTVENFDSAREFLEALGYRAGAYYEKYRSTYELGKTQVMLDQLPFGDFVEVEGESPDSIRAVADQLALNWSAALDASYLGLFEQIRTGLGLDIQQSSFEAFEGILVEPVRLGLRYADSRA